MDVDDAYEAVEFINNRYLSYSCCFTLIYNFIQLTKDLHKVEIIYDLTGEETSNYSLSRQACFVKHMTDCSEDLNSRLNVNVCIFCKLIFR